MYVVKAEFTDGDACNNFIGNFGPFTKSSDAEIAVLNLSCRDNCINSVIHEVGEYSLIGMATEQQEGSS
jgi:hypothetical protein